MTTTTPKFELTHRHAGLGLAVIASLCLSLAVGFVAHAQTAPRTASPELSASAPVAATHHAS